MAISSRSPSASLDKYTGLLVSWKLGLVHSESSISSLDVIPTNFERIPRFAIYVLPQILPSCSFPYARKEHVINAIQWNTVSDIAESLEAPFLWPAIRFGSMCCTRFPKRKSLRLDDRKSADVRRYVRFEHILRFRRATITKSNFSSRNALRLKATIERARLAVARECDFFWLPA